MTFVVPVHALFHDAAGELEQIHLPLGHASVQTSEEYIG
jgi:hypothetical protein